MVRKCIILMCGPSGSGKSTWAKNFMNRHHEVPIYYISRDEVRFSIITNKDNYFAKEDEVFKKWISRIQSHLNSNEDCYIIADATHLSERSRNKTLDALNLPNDIKIIPININPGVEVCLDRNEKRSGRAKVPRSVIRRMCFTYEPPHEHEKYKYYQILGVQENIE